MSMEFLFPLLFYCISQIYKNFLDIFVFIYRDVIYFLKQYFFQGNSNEVGCK